MPLEHWWTMNDFLQELKRRKVVRVAAVYAATGFVVLQAAELLAGGLALPGWVFPTVTVLVVLGFPVALVLAWALELTPDGVRVTPPAESEGARSRGTGTTPTLLGRRALVLSALLVAVGIGLGFGAGWFLGPDAGLAAAGAPDLLAPGGPAADNSIAVLPFTDLSQSGDQKWFADGLAEEILSSLVRLPELRVVGRGSSSQFQGDQRADAEIAAALGVSHLLKGSVRRVAEQLRVTAQLLRADDGVQLWSESYDGAAGDLLDVQRDVAEKVAVALDVLMDDERRERMFEAGTRNVAAFEAYLRGREIFQAAHGAAGGSLADANAWFERAMELDPRFGRPALLHADRYAHRVLFGPGDARLDLEHMPVEEALVRLHRSLDLAIRHAPDPLDRVIAELDRELFSPTWHRVPTLVDELRRHVAQTRPSGADNWTTFLLVAIGQAELARDYAEQRVRSDPLNPVLWFNLVVAKIALGDLPGARARVLEARRMAGDHAYLQNAEITVHLLSAEPDAALSLLGASRRHRALDAALRGDSAAVLAYAREIEAAQDWPGYRLLTAYHLLGDVERNRALTRRIDAMPSGHAIFTVHLYGSGGALTFDLADAPNFSARLREAGADPGSFRTMPRSRARQE
jgi:adenylate cyclase